MGKRSNFERVPRDLYRTFDLRAVPPLLPHIRDVSVYVEPCAGACDLVNLLLPHGKRPVAQYDIVPLHRDVVKRDALSLTVADLHGASTIITNPPWDRKLLHALIEHFLSLGVTFWLLFDSSWLQTLQSSYYVPYCRKVVAIGRLRWIPDTDMDGKDDCQWYCFSPHHVGEPTLFYGRSINGKRTR